MIITKDIMKGFYTQEQVTWLMSSHWKDCHRSGSRIDQGFRVKNEWKAVLCAICLAMLMVVPGSAD